jgi:hypothetical protein
MSAAFALDFSGPEAPCGFPRCILGAFHDGDHAFAKSKAIAWTYDRHCVVCGVPFTVLGAEVAEIFHTCGSQECLLHYARHEAPSLEVMCRCPQRSYPHQLAIHALVRQEAYNPKVRTRWPWSLTLSRREEPSTERNAA